MEIPRAVLQDWNKAADVVARGSGVAASIVTQAANSSMRVAAAGGPDGQLFRRTERLPDRCLSACRLASRHGADLETNVNLHSNTPRVRAVVCGLWCCGGIPIRWPDGRMFGSVCLLHQWSRPVGPVDTGLLDLIRRVIERDLRLCVWRNMGERRSGRGKVRELERLAAVGRIALGITHDFNNLVQAVVAHGDLLLRRMDPMHTEHGVVKEIVAASRAASSLVGRLMAFAAGRRPDVGKADLNSVVRGTRGIVRQLLGRAISLEMRLDPELGVVAADPVRLEELVFNLVLNARQAMPDGGAVIIRTSREMQEGTGEPGSGDVPQGEYGVLVVEDTGVGMNEDTLERIFEPFFTTRKEGANTGLGLTSVQDIVRECSGHVRVASAPGRGTTFRVYLKRA